MEVLNCEKEAHADSRKTREANLELAKPEKKLKKTGKSRVTSADK